MNQKNTLKRGTTPNAVASRPAHCQCARSVEACKTSELKVKPVKHADKHPGPPSLLLGGSMLNPQNFVPSQPVAR